ncbi:chitobiase/beta-hexosaminidase C-terminal domain-containing protein [Butyrivibrio sp. WCD3002]|uniref:chitobiase/beta-hexosaminidase C-terminal domain-containing protein n=1 Tax=Butyrivibrio sp. WCD3002 TaxID=1280676 RepID=UPI00041F855C|nr:chitobiase/beta-hexosaminidase C-terminal domain-containing protein [Butyrivibrio sp. WCD3002]
MKCPKCGATIPDGLLYCEVCGEEISFVPEFDPEVENQIDETLSDMADNLNSADFDTKRLHLIKSNQHSINLKAMLPAIIKGAAIFIIALIVCLILIKGIHSAKSSEEQAKDYYVNGNYDKAIEMINKAISEVPENDLEKRAELYFELFGYQTEAGYTESSIKTLYELVNEDLYDKETVSTAVGYIIDYYLDNKDYAAINSLVNSFKDAGLKSKYAEYLSAMPIIYPEEGEYENSLEITMSKDSQGEIYYTVNGENPDTESIMYEEPLVLEEDGEYIIRAVFVNKYGIVSDVATAVYTLLNTGPAAPEVLEESGDYSQTTMIAVVGEPGCTIYYTNDGTDPDENSTPYISPINMPVGTTTYKFIAVDENGKYSDIVERTYHLTYSRLVSVDQARASIIQILLKLDIILDGNGSVRGGGHYEYMYDGDIEIEGSGEYYVFKETLMDNDGTTKDTGLLYAVNTHDGKVNRLGYDSSGKYTLITISNR